MHTLKKIYALTIFSVATNAAFAIDGVSVDVGEGDVSSIYKIAAQNSLGDEIPFLRDYDLSAYYELSAAEIVEQQYHNIRGDSHSIADFGLTPAVRWQKPSKYGTYAEVGVGLNYMSEKYNNNGRIASTQFQFGDHIGVGYKFANNVDLLLKFQHYSNADIKTPNPAINFVMLKLTYSF